MTIDDAGRFYVGNCLNVLRRIRAGVIDLVLTDLPYGKTKATWDRLIDLDLLWEEYKRVLKPNGVAVLFATQPFATDLISSNRGWFRYDLVWEKNKSTGHLNANRMQLRRHELLLVFYAQLPTYNPQKTTGHKRVNAFYTRSSGQANERQSGGGSTERHPTSIMPFSVVNGNDPLRTHSAQKPVELLRHVIRTYTDAGDTVLDSCAGSGATAVAAVAEGRKYVCIEIDPKMAERARAWLRKVGPLPY